MAFGSIVYVSRTIESGGVTLTEHAHASLPDDIVLDPGYEAAARGQLAAALFRALPSLEPSKPCLLPPNSRN